MIDGLHVCTGNNVLKRKEEMSNALKHIPDKILFKIVAKETNQNECKSRESVFELLDNLHIHSSVALEWFPDQTENMVESHVSVCVCACVCVSVCGEQPRQAAI